LRVAFSSPLFHAKARVDKGDRFATIKSFFDKNNHLLVFTLSIAFDDLSSVDAVVVAVVVSDTTTFRRHYSYFILVFSLLPITQIHSKKDFSLN
jgi:hypothetical protein